MTAHHPPGQATPGSPPAKMRRVAFASFIGTVVEFYDFGIYATAAALVFAKVFFPALGTNAGTAVAFATLGVAFVARPVGAIRVSLGVASNFADVFRFACFVQRLVRGGPSCSP